MSELLLTVCIVVLLYAPALASMAVVTTAVALRDSEDIPIVGLDIAGMSLLCI